MDTPRSVGRGTVWESSGIELEKKFIRNELEQVRKDQGPKKALDHILFRIHELEDADHGKALLHRYIYVMSALVHHERYGGLSSKQYLRLFELGKAILKVKGIQPGRSRLGFLFGDLYQVVSQRQQREGQHWLSAWQQQAARYSSQPSQSHHHGLHCLANAIRELRMGDALSAECQFRVAEETGLSPRSQVRSRLERIKALRLARKWDQAQSLNRLTRKLSLSPEEQRELDWEKWCLSAQKNQDLEVLVWHCHPGRSHHQHDYVMETYLWMRAIKSRYWLKKFSRIKRLSRGLPSALPRGHKFWWECILSLEDCYDSKIPFLFRVERLGTMLSRSSQFFSIDKETLFWASAARWLSRTGSDGFNRIVFNSYKALSLRLTSGAHHDSLNVLGDLVEKDLEKSLENIPKAA